jgi:hypothetical protein
MRARPLIQLRAADRLDVLDGSDERHAAAPSPLAGRRTVQQPARRLVIAPSALEKNCLVSEFPAPDSSRGVKAGLRSTDFTNPDWPYIGIAVWGACLVKGTL